MRSKLVVGSALVFLTMAASAASFSGQGEPRTYPWQKSAASAQARAEARPAPVGGNSIELAAPVKADKDCLRTRRTMWVDGQGWIVKRAGACQSDG